MPMMKKSLTFKMLGRSMFLRSRKHWCVLTLNEIVSHHEHDGHKPYNDDVPKIDSNNPGHMCPS